MRVLFISKSGDGLGLAIRLQLDGHDVAMWIKEANFTRAGKGIIQRPVSWREKIAWADLVVVDMVSFGVHEQLFRRLGKPYLCCSPAMDEIELDRKKGMQLFEQAKINIPETFYYEGLAKARKEIPTLDWQKGFVFKPDANIATAKTLVVRDKERLEWVLTQYKEDVSMVVQRIVDGIEISTEGWFNGRDFIRPFNHTFEEKRFMNDDLGPNTGCSGNVVFTTQGDKLTAETVEKLKPFLSKTGYRGPVDINTIINEENSWALEATCRLGYDACEALVEGLREPLIDLLFETATGTKKEMELSNQYLIAVRLTVPPYPMEKVKPEDHGEPILGLDEFKLKHIFLCDVYFEDNELKYAGSDGVVLKATASGRDVREAKRRVYRTLKDVKVGSKQYRTDIGDRVPGDIEKLKSMGWLK